MITNYLILAFDSTGYEDDDVIIAAHYKLVAEGDQFSQSRYLDWSPRLSRQWLEFRMARIPEDRRSKSWKVDGGEEPARVLGDLINLISNLPPDGILVGHAITSFGLPILERNLAQCLPHARLLVPNVWDVGMWHKATRAGITPWNGESISDFCSRLSRDAIPGVKWSLSECLSAEGLLGQRMPGPGSFKVQQIEALYRKQRGRLGENIAWDPLRNQWSYADSTATENPLEAAWSPGQFSF
jgi:hypothetical protein